MKRKAGFNIRLFCPRKEPGYTAHYFTDNRNLSENRKDHSFRFSGRLFTFTTDNGVFSKSEIDEGSEILLKTIEQKGIHGSVLDLGCGYGVIGITLKTLFPDTHVKMVDINPRAVELAGINCTRNSVECDCCVSDGLNQVRETFDYIITNPPIRTGKKVIYKMFEDSYAHLHENGELIAVIRRKQGAESAVKKFQEIFGNCTILERNRGFWVIQGKKLTN